MSPDVPAMVACVQEEVTDIAASNNCICQLAWHRKAAAAYQLMMQQPELQHQTAATNPANHPLSQSTCTCHPVVCRWRTGTTQLCLSLILCLLRCTHVIKQLIIACSAVTKSVAWQCFGVCAAVFAQCCVQGPTSICSLLLV